MSSSNCCFLTFMYVSQEAGKVVCYPHLLKNFPQFIVIHTVKGFGRVNKTEIDAFLELSCFFHDPADVGNLISGSSAFSKSSLYMWNFSVHILLKTSLKDFEHSLASMWSKRNFFGIGMKTRIFRELLAELLLCESLQTKLVEWNSIWVISNPKRWCCESAALSMSANLENSAVATGLEKVSFHSNPKERQCQRMLKLPHNCTHLTH